MGRGWIRSQRGLPRGNNTKIRAVVPLRTLLRFLIAALTIIWVILSLYISGNLDPRPNLAFRELAQYAERFLHDDWNFDSKLNKTMQRLILSTPKQAKPDITISDAPPTCKTTNSNTANYPAISDRAARTIVPTAPSLRPTRPGGSRSRWNPSQIILIISTRMQKDRTGS